MIRLILESQRHLTIHTNFLSCYFFFRLYFSLGLSNKMSEKENAVIYIKIRVDFSFNFEHSVMRSFPLDPDTQRDCNRDILEMDLLA